MNGSTKPDQDDQQCLPIVGDKHDPGSALHTVWPPTLSWLPRNLVVSHTLYNLYRLIHLPSDTLTDSKSPTPATINEMLYQIMPTSHISLSNRQETRTRLLLPRTLLVFQLTATR